MQNSTTVLPRGVVHVWLADVVPCAQAALRTPYPHGLSAPDLAKFQAFRFEQDRHRFLATRALVRALLSTYVDLPLSAWRFGANPYGKPFVLNQQAQAVGLRFNVSHSSDRIAVALAKGRELGIDTEDANSAPPLEVAEGFFSMRERLHLRTLPTHRRAATFWALWTLKESYVKARGLGLSLPLNEFSVHVRDDDSVTLDAEDSSSWSLFLCRASGFQPVAVCVERVDSAPLQILQYNVCPSLLSPLAVLVK